MCIHKEAHISVSPFISQDCVFASGLPGVPSVLSVESDHVWGKHGGRRMQGLWLQLQRNSGENAVGTQVAILGLEVGILELGGPCLGWKDAAHGMNAHKQ